MTNAGRRTCESPSAQAAGSAVSTPDALARFDRALFARAPLTLEARLPDGRGVTVTLQHKPMPTHWGSLSNPSLLVRFAAADGSLAPRSAAQSWADEAVRAWLALPIALPIESARVRVVAAETSAPGHADPAASAALQSLLQEWPAPD